MTQQHDAPASDSGAIDEEALLAEFESEKPARQLSGLPLTIVRTMGVGLSLFALYWVFHPMAKQFYLPIFLGVGTSMTFLVYRGRGRSDKARASAADNPHWSDWLLAIVTLVPFIYIVYDWDSFFRRAIFPTPLDLTMGTIAIAAALETARRTVGILVPIVVLAFFGYAFWGPIFPEPFGTSSYDWARLVGHNVM